MTTSPSRRLTWEENKKAKELAQQLVMIHRHQPEIVASEGDAAFTAYLLNYFDARYITPKEHERIIRLERD